MTETYGTVLETDEAVQKYGHTALRLHVAHCKFNSIELEWASVKGYFARHNTWYTLQVQQLTIVGFARSIAHMWRNVSRHVVKVEEDLMVRIGSCRVSLVK